MFYPWKTIEFWPIRTPQSPRWSMCTRTWLPMRSEMIYRPIGTFSEAFSWQREGPEHAGFCFWRFWQDNLSGRRSWFWSPFSFRPWLHACSGPTECSSVSKSLGWNFYIRTIPEWASPSPRSLWAAFSYPATSLTNSQLASSSRSLSPPD